MTRKDGHHPIIFMQCGPVRHRVDAKAQAAARPFEHTIIVRPTTFQAGPATGTDKRIEFQSLYSAPVLRYLAEDLAKDLDSVLDGILRSLSSRRNAGLVANPITVVRGSRV